MFDHYLSQSQRSSRPTVALVTASLVAHTIALGGLLLVSGVFSVEELQPPALEVTLFSPSTSISTSPAVGGVIHGETIAPRAPRSQSKGKKLVEPASRRPVLGTIFASADQPEPEVDDNRPGLPEKQGGDTLLDVAPAAQRGAGGILEGVRLDSERLLYPDPHLPEEFTSKHPQETIVAVYRLCIHTNGSITEVTPIRGVAEIDRAVIQHLMTSWLYRPRAIPICVARRFIFLID
jgi:hypothetical protein